MNNNKDISTTGGRIKILPTISYINNTQPEEEVKQSPLEKPRKRKINTPNGIVFFSPRNI